MADNEIVQYEAAPGYLQKYAPTTEQLKEFAVPGGTPIGVISTEGKKFAVRLKGEIYPAIDERGFAMQYLDLVIAASSETITKTWFAKEYAQGMLARPDCYSLNGIVPEADSPLKQNPTCQGCRHNAWGTKGKGKACSDGKRLGVLQTSHIDGAFPAEGTGPLLFRLPPITFANFGKYVREDLARDRRILPYGVVTRVSFDPSATWDLNFRFARYLDELEAQWVDYWREDPDAIAITNRVLGLSEQADVLEDPEPEPEPVQAPPTPVQRTQPPQQATQRPDNAPQAAQEPRQAPPAQVAPIQPPPRQAAGSATSRAPQPATRRPPPTATAPGDPGW